MLVLGGIFITMVLVSIGLLAVPALVGKKIILSKSFIFSALFLTVVPFLLYRTTSDGSALRQWFVQGEEHYQLQVVFNQLGGIEGAIANINKQLANHPEDSQGWLILGKLYRAQHDDAKSAAAFKKAQALDLYNKHL